MYDQIGIWEMNKAHHQELLEVAEKHRLLRMVRARRPVTLEALRRMLHLPAITLGVTRRRQQWRAEHNLSH